MSRLVHSLRAVLVGLPVAAAALLALGEAQALKPITTGEILSRATSGFGYSYWWGHGKWKGGGVTNPGVCSGSCGGCSHKGSYGADCSGYVAKAWRVPDSNAALESDSHPYSTYSFRHEKSNWKPVARNTAKEGDAFVYNSGGKGHVFLFVGWTGKGTAKIYESAGCKKKIGSTTKAIGSAYIAIRRNETTSSKAPVTPGNGDGSNVLCTIPAHCGAGKFCCDSDGDGTKHCTTTACAAPPVTGGGTGDGTKTCDVANPDCNAPFSNCCDNDGDGAFHCTSSTCKSCAHDVCTSGAALRTDCGDTCVATMCASDPYCCEQRWDLACIAKVPTVCGRTCAPQ